MKSFIETMDECLVFNPHVTMALCVANRPKANEIIIVYLGQGHAQLASGNYK